MRGSGVRIPPGAPNVSLPEDCPHASPLWCWLASCQSTAWFLRRLAEDVMFEVETRNVAGHVTAVGSAGTFTLVVDRPVEAGGGGLGFNRGRRRYLPVAGCVAHDLFREARPAGITLTHARARVRGDFS